VPTKKTTSDKVFGLKEKRKYSYKKAKAKNKNPRKGTPGNPLRTAGPIQKGPKY